MSSSASRGRLLFGPEAEEVDAVEAEVEPAEAEVEAVAVEADEVEAAEAAEVEYVAVVSPSAVTHITYAITSAIAWNKKPELLKIWTQICWAMKSVHKLNSK